jgi:hypothetical protein
MPGEPGAANTASAAALRAYAGGASISEACIEARRVVGSWSRHPSREVRRPSLAAVS